MNNTDIYLFHRGEHRRAYEYLGAHINSDGVTFRVWSPNAKSVRVVGCFNSWNNHTHFMNKINDNGIWELHIRDAKKFHKYKFCIEDKHGNLNLKADPYAFYSEVRPHTASVVYGLSNYNWTDEHWLHKRAYKENVNRPVNIYEVHLGSWQRSDDGGFLNYRELAHKLCEYVKYMNYTHVELLPISEYPLDDSWGYQITGYFSVTSRYGTPEDFKYFVNHLHSQGIGIILDWVPGHFCKDAHGLHKFDGESLYEHPNPHLGENPQWGTCNFDFARNEVRSFLNSNALYWFREFHIDGIRIDAVANILYLSFGKYDGFNITNEHGGDENIGGINFLKEVNHILREEIPNVMTFAEDSTTWGHVTKSAVDGGLGFTYKWNMGFMNDTLKYMKHDPYYRMSCHNDLTFSFIYAFSENYILAISHDEVVHGKSSMLNKMPGSFEDKIYNLRLYNAYLIAHPGKKLNFMGNEIAQGLEWRFNEALEWNVLTNDVNKGYHEYIRHLNKFYLDNEPLWEKDSESSSWKWIDSNPHDNILSFMRVSKHEELITIFNFSGSEKTNYNVGVPTSGEYEEVFNSREANKINTKSLEAKKIQTGDMQYSINVFIPPLTAMFFKKVKK